MKETLRKANVKVNQFVAEHPIEYVVTCIVAGYFGGRILRRICE